MATLAPAERHEDLTDICQQVELACVHIGSLDETERTKASDILLALPQSPCLVDVVRYLLTKSTQDAVHFHVLGAFLTGIAHVDDLLQLEGVCEWLLQRATHHASPAYVRARYVRAIVILSLRMTGLSTRTTPNSTPLLTLGKHAQSLLHTHDIMGWALASALAHEFLDQDEDRTSAGLRENEFVWCAALVQVAVIPDLVPVLLSSFHATGPSSPVWPIAADCVQAWLGWRCVSLPDTPSSHAELWTYVRDTPPEPPLPGVTLRVSPPLAPLYLHPDVATVLGHAARQAPSPVPTACYEAMLHVANYRPWSKEVTGTWPEQRAALLHVLMDLTEMPNASDDDIAALQRVTHIYTQLMYTDSGCVLMQGAVSAPMLLEALVRVSTVCLHVAFDRVPRGSQATEASDAAVDQALALWRSLLCALPESDAAHVHSYVREHVVLPYQAGRLHAAALTAELDADDLWGEEDAQDADLYDDQLTLYATLARTCVREALAHLSSIVQQPAMRDIVQMRPATWEQWHWLALMLGHLVADAGEGEIASVPEALRDAPADALLRECFAWQGVLAMHGPHGSATPASPQTLASLLWLMARWVPAYLLQENPSPVERPFAGDGGLHILDEWAGCCHRLVQSWSNDAQVLIAMAHVWDALARSPGAMRVWLAKDQVYALVRDDMLGSLEALPDTVQAPLLRAVVRCVDATRDGPQASAEHVRSLYYPLIVQAAQARMNAAALAPSPLSIQSALALWCALAEAADPSTSGLVHVHLCTQLPAMTALVSHQAAQADVQITAMQAMHALLRAAPDLDAAVLPDLARYTFVLLESAHACLGNVRDADATQESVIVTYLHVVEELVRACTEAPMLHTWCLRALEIMAPVLSLDVLRIPSISEALATLIHAMLIILRPALFASAEGAEAVPNLAAPFDEPCFTRMPAFQLVVRASLYLIGTCDARTESVASAVAQGLGYVAEGLPSLTSPCPAVQVVMDDAIRQLCLLVFLRPMQPAMLTPLILALRRTVLSRLDAHALGGAETLLPSLAASCHTPAYRAAVEQAMQHVWESRAPPPVPAPTPVMTARMQAKAEQAAALALNRTLRPLVQHARQTLRLHT